MSQKFSSIMQQEFEMFLLGQLAYFFGLQVQQAKYGIFLSKKYLKKILKKYGIEVCKPICTPMMTWCSLISNDDSTTISQPEDRSMTGSLLYLIGTRKDIMHAVGIVECFQANSKESHLHTVNRIFIYLQGTK